MQLKIEVVDAGATFTTRLGGWAGVIEKLSLELPQLKLKLKLSVAFLWHLRYKYIKIGIH